MPFQKAGKCGVGYTARVYGEILKSPLRLAVLFIWLEICRTRKSERAFGGKDAQ